MRAALDVMGGDHAPGVVIQGCWDAAPLLDGDDLIYLVGDEKVITEALANCPLPADQKARFKPVIATQVIAMRDHPVESLRNKPDSSINVMCRLASKGEADVVISAGNTGACVAGAQLRMRTLPGVSRPGIAVVLPTMQGPVVLCDVGANPEPKPRHMQQYAIMASAYASVITGKAKPRVGLLNIGEEDSKGTTAALAAHKVLANEPQIDFVGNVEGRELFRGAADVVVCDGFVGNILLKFFEGAAEGLFKQLLGAMQAMAPDLLPRIGPVMKKVQHQVDWREYGGAPLLGVNGNCVICHGSSDARAIKNAIRAGKQLVTSRINETIVQTIQKSVPVEE